MESVESGDGSVSTAAGVGIYARGDPEKGMRPGSGKREALVFPEALSKDAQLAPGVRAERFGRCRVSQGCLTARVPVDPVGGLAGAGFPKGA